MLPTFDRTPSLTVVASCVAALFCVFVVVQAPAVASSSPASAGVPTTAGESEIQPGFVVDLDANGSARMTLSTTFDLTTESERQSFETLRENTTLRDGRIEQFQSRMQAVAERAQAQTGREMAIRNATITFTDRGDTGVVSLAVTWAGLASVDGDRLLLDEPFESGFAVDQPFRVVGPDSHELRSVTPTPQDRALNAATWDAGTTLDGFEAVFASAASTSPDGDRSADTERTTMAETQPQNNASGSGPGFGFVLTTLAILLVVSLGLSRQ